MQIAAGQEQAYAQYKELNSKDSYSKGVVDFGERWADLMEKEIAQGKTVVEIAEEASHKADTDGITGFMYGAAVSALSQFWAHGKDLAKWHNRQYLPEVDAATEEGGTVNPAIITVKL